MEKVKTLLSKLDYCNVILALYLVKCLVISVSYQDAIIFLALCGLVGFKKYNDRFISQDNLDNKFKNEMKEEVDDLKKAIAVFKMGDVLPNKRTDNKKYF